MALARDPPVARTDETRYHPVRRNPNSDVDLPGIDENGAKCVELNPGAISGRHPHTINGSNERKP